jgi:uncharacterized protein
VELKQLIFKNKISEFAELRTHLGEPGMLAANKTIDFLDGNCRNFLSKSPFVVLSTSDSNGVCDSSPRGDAPGFVHILNDTCLVIPERPGNRRLDSIKNLLDNPHVGLLFMIPGLEETLRINGRASIIRDEDILEQMKVHDKRPLMGIAVEVFECFIHCGKAFKRSGLWNQATWAEKGDLPSAAKMVAEHAELPNYSEKEVAAALADSYKNRLY